MNYQNDNSSCVVTGGGGIRSHFARPDAGPPLFVRPQDPLGDVIADLLNLHPEISLQFRALDLTQMNEKTKELLLKNIHALLKSR
jgi:hypothetical protein